MLFPAVMGIKVKLMSVCSQHLGNGVFIEHSLINGKPILYNLLVQLPVRQFIFIKGMAH